MTKIPDIIRNREYIVARIDKMIRMRATASPSVTDLNEWKAFIVYVTTIPEHLDLDAYNAAENAYTAAERDLDDDAPPPLEVAIKAFLAATFGPPPVLEPCPFCKKPLTMRTGMNPLAKCTTPRCWMAARQIAIAVDDTEQVRAWNDRADEVAS